MRTPPTVGVRPEDLRAPGDENGSSALTLPATVTRVEALGANVLCFFAVDARPVKAAALAAPTGEIRLRPIAGGTGEAMFCASFEPRLGLRAGDKLDVRERGTPAFLRPETEAAIRARGACGRAREAQATEAAALMPRTVE